MVAPDRVMVGDGAAVRDDRLAGRRLDLVPDRHLGAAAAGRDETCRVVVLTGAGRAFCAGQDLADTALAGGSDVGNALEELYNPLIKTIASFDKPIIAAVNGVAAGAGANIALACDLVSAARSASFLQAFARIGLVPDAGGTWVLPRLVGPMRARGLPRISSGR